VNEPDRMAVAAAKLADLLERDNRFEGGFRL
jgi:hypothetical protein